MSSTTEFYYHNFTKSPEWFEILIFISDISFMSASKSSFPRETKILE